MAKRTKRNQKAEGREIRLRAPLPPLFEPIPERHNDYYPDYPEDWIDRTEECGYDYLLPAHIANVPSRTSYALTGEARSALQTALKYVQQVTSAINTIAMELHEHTNTVHGIKDLFLALNRDVHILAIKKLKANEPIDNEFFPENVRVFAENYFKQKKELLLMNTNGVLCGKYPPNQQKLHERPRMIVMPQLYQHEILFKAHDAMGHQGIAKVLSRIQERHTWPGIRKSVSRYVSQYMTCQKVRHKPGDMRFDLEIIQSGYFNEKVQYDQMKICPSDNKNTGILVIIDHLSKFADAVPCHHDKNDATSTSRRLLQN